MHHVDVSILIVNWNTRDYLRQALQSIQETVREVEYEVLVVDNASRDGSAEMVRREFPRFRLLENPENLGFARGNNQALALARGAYILVMNPDVVLDPGTLEGLVAFARGRPDAGVISPKLLNPDRTLQSFYGKIPDLTTVFFLYTWVGAWLDGHLLGGRLRRRQRYEDHGDFQEVLCFTDGGAGFSCSLIPRRVIEEIGFMDERFPVFFNDGDFGMRLFQAGYRACLLPHVKAIHYGGSSVRQLDRLAYNQEYVYGLRTFSRTYRGFFYTRAIEGALFLNVLLEALGNLWGVLKRAKGLRSLPEPFLHFGKALSYRPGIARPYLYRLPGGTGEEGLTASLPRS